MRATLLLCTAFLLAPGACGRTSLKHPTFSDDGLGYDGSADVPGSGGIADAALGGTTTGPSPGTGGVAGYGGASGTGGRLDTGGRLGTGGGRSGGTPGAGGRPGGTAGTRTGGAGGMMGSGGILTGGSVGVAGRPGTGGRLGTGGMALGGRLGTGGMALGGRPGTGGMALGGRLGTGGGTGPTCGNGKVDPGEQCDSGSDNQDWPAVAVTRAGQRFVATPLVRTSSSSEFYAYSSSSAHTGLEDVGTSRIMLHLYTADLGLSLVFFHGVDKDSTGLEQPESKVQFLFSGLPPTTAVAVDDDEISDELLITSEGKATGFWHFTNNSDGGVFSGLPFPGDWQITLEPTFMSGISSWAWVQTDISLVGLDLSQPLTIEAHSSAGKCRSDCTIPFCGDGILDGGEVCDPGIATGYTCSSDCKSFSFY